MSKKTAAITFICLMSSVAIYAAASSALPELMTSAKNNYWQTGTCTKVTTGTADITVDENNKKQKWEGFGGTFNEMGWDALSVVSSEIPNVMKLLFSATDGCNFVYGRVPVGASDYAMSWYTLDETAGDYTMSHFSIARDREKLIPFIKAGLQVKPNIHLWASPWNVPSWMASNGIKSDAQTQGAHALYLAKFVEEYAKEGLKIEAMHPQNEPGYCQTRWAQSLLINYFKNYLGPVFTQRNLTTEIWCGTMSAPEDSQIAQAVANDPESMKYVKGFGLQWNHTTTTASLAPKGRVWQTEHRCGNYPFEAPYWDIKRYDSNKPQNDHLYAEESWQLIRDWVAGGVNAYCAWNMVLDTYGKSLGNWPQNALIVVDRSTKKVIITPAYYVFRHFSQYVDSGATRIGTTGSNDVLAFKNPDGNIVTQVYNKDSLSKKTIVDVSGTLYQFDVPGHGWATLSVKPSTSVHSTPYCQNQHDFKITSNNDGYRVSLSSHESGRVDLMTLSGQVLESKCIPQGRDVFLSKRVSPSANILLARVVTGNKTSTVRLFNTK